MTAELRPLSITGAPGEDRAGGFRLTRFASEETGCERHLVPATQEYTVAVSATRRDGLAEFCSIADAATDGALAVLASGELPAAPTRPIRLRSPGRTPADCSPKPYPAVIRVTWATASATAPIPVRSGR
ncbi:hypothetical protein ACPZ19_05550 [Amycolatopsis lurida]